MQATVKELLSLFSEAQTIFFTVEGETFQLNVERLPSKAQARKVVELVTRLIDDRGHADYDVEAIEVDYA